MKNNFDLIRACVNAIDSNEINDTPVQSNINNVLFMLLNAKMDNYYKIDDNGERYKKLQEIKMQLRDIIGA